MGQFTSLIPCQSDAVLSGAKEPGLGVVCGGSGYGGGQPGDNRKSLDREGGRVLD